MPDYGTDKQIIFDPSIIPLDTFSSTRDINDLDTSINFHGLTPKLPNDVDLFLRGDGQWMETSESVAPNLTRIGAIYVDGVTHLANTNVDLFTIDEDMSVRYGNIICCNQSASIVYVNVAHIENGTSSSLSNKDYLVYSMMLDAFETKTISIPVANDFDTIVVKSSHIGVSFVYIGETVSVLRLRKPTRQASQDITSLNDVLFFSCSTAISNSVLFVCNRNNDYTSFSLAHMDSTLIGNLAPEDYIFTQYPLEPYETFTLEGFSVGVNESLVINTNKTNMNVILYGENKFV